MKQKTGGVVLSPIVAQAEKNRGMLEMPSSTFNCQHSILDFEQESTICPYPRSTPAIAKLSSGEKIQ
jgi:hypothetical protein